MEQQVREYLNHCLVPVTSEAAVPGSGPGPGTGPGPGHSGPPPPPGPAGCMANRMLSRNANGTIAMTTQPTNESELQLYRVLQRANLLSYYDTFICQGGDDVQQLCEAGEEEFLEIMALVGMASKPLHVRRLQKALQEWVNNPAMFQTPLVPALTPNHPNHPMNPMNAVSRAGGPVNLSQPALPMRPSPPIPMLTNNSHSSPSPGNKDVPSPSQLQQQQQQQQQQQHQQQQHQQHQQHLQHQQQQPPGGGGPHQPPPPHPQSLPQGGGEYGQPTSPISLTPVLVECQIQRLSDAAEFLMKTLPPFEPKSQNKKRISKELEVGSLLQECVYLYVPYVMNMAEDDPRRMDEIRKYAAIYGRFDCKRKPEKPLTLHEVSVNEAAAQICKHIPALLTRRDELFPLARQVVRDSGYQYSKGHSRSQCYSKPYDEEICKRLRLDQSPSNVHAPDKAQLEDEMKKRQERLDAIADQLKLMGNQQEELKSRLQQAREMQNFAAANHVQAQLEQLSTQQMQLINEQSKLNKDLRRLDRFFSGGKGCGRLSSCSEPDKMDDDTDSQFSVYSTTSSPTLNHDANDSPSQDANQCQQSSEAFSSMKMVPGKKTSAQITKQLVQETLIDEGLRVVKELANQIREDNNIHIPPPKPEGRPRGRPPKLDRDYTISTASATSAIHTATSGSATMPATSLASSGPPTPIPPAQNGRSPVSVNGPLENSSASHVDIMTVPITNGTSGLQHGTGNSDKSNDTSQSDNKGSENSLNALLAFSQKGLIKQEPPSPTINFKME